MYKELYNNDIFSLFDFQSFRVFQNASQICGNKEIPALEDIFLSLIYLSPELFDFVDYDLRIKLEEDLKKVSRDLSFNKLAAKTKLENFLEQLAFLAKFQQNLITSPLLLLALLKDKFIRFVFENRLLSFDILIKKLSDYGITNPPFLWPLNVLATQKKYKLIGKEATINIIKESLGTYLSTNLLIMGPAGVGKSSLALRIPLIIREDKKLGKAVRDLKTFQINSVEDFFCFERLRTNNLIDQSCLLIVDLKENNFWDLSIIRQSYFDNFNSEKILSKLIVFVNTEEYHSIIKINPDFFKSFSITELREPVGEELIAIIKDFSTELEKYYQIVIPDIIIETLIEYSNKFSSWRALPGRALKILDETCSLARVRETGILEARHLQEIVENFHRI